MLSLTLMTLAPFAVTMVSANCYGSGDSGNKETANNGLDTLCATLQGYYQPQQLRAGCVSVATEPTYWYFEIKQTGWGGTMSYEQCKKELSARFCDDGKGGDDGNNGWYYRADPGKGHCTDIQYINQHSVYKRGDEPNQAPETQGNVTVYLGDFHPSHEILKAISAAYTDETTRGNDKAPQSSKNRGKVETVFKA